MSETKRSYASVWNDLSEVDCSDHVEVKDIGRAKLTYLSWAWAWKMMMTKYPNMQVLWMDPSKEGGERGVIYSPDGTAMVHCRVVIPVDPNAVTFHPVSEQLSREMWLPVMDGRNKAIQNPDSRAISDAKMRCLVKTFALFGLGHYIYAGEDIPHDPAKERLIEQHIQSIRGHSKVLMDELAPAGLPAEFVNRMKAAIESRDLDDLKKAPVDAQHRIEKVREMKESAEEVNMNPDDESVEETTSE
jgi:hypothetical protein